MSDLIEDLPGPFELLLEPVSLAIFAMYYALILWESLFPARKLPEIKNWRLKGIVSFVLFFYLSSYLPLLWDQHLVQFQLFDLTQLGTFGGAMVAFLIYELGLYLWHRLMHKNNTLWRVFHQMHHSAERMDSFGAFYFSPMDILGFSLLGSLCLVVVAGFTAEATTLFILFTSFLGIFQHSNIKTPVWLGYIVQRPESHTVHHARGSHADNYSDLAIIDMLFGTFRNPKAFENETGFFQGSSSKIKDMLLFRDINRNNQ